MANRATPNLPSRDFAATSAFYARLGFVDDYRALIDPDGTLLRLIGNPT
jgi:predicted lactoylglutathione lyase